VAAELTAFGRARKRERCCARYSAAIQIAKTRRVFAIWIAAGPGMLDIAAKGQKLP
jgi:hypothetical protein